MKKVLFATTALVMTAGAAAAEVAVSGTGRMGVIYDGDDMQFSSRARVIFTLTGESDAGLSFGGEFRADNAGNANRGIAGHVYVSGTYGKLSMGDVVSASEEAIGDLYSVGYTDTTFAGDIEEISYLTADGENLDQGPSALYEYTMDQISIYASMSDGSDNVKCGLDAIVGTDEVCDVEGDDEESDVAYSLAAKYSADNFSAGLGYAKQGDASEIVLGGEGKFNNFAVKGIFAKYDDRFVDDLEFKHTVGVSASYQADAVLVKGFFRQDKWTEVATGDTMKMDSWGIGADYDLGGGAVLAGGIVDSDYLNDTVADLGVKFKF